MCPDTPARRGERRAARILAADDQQHILDAIDLLLRPQGYEVHLAQIARAGSRGTGDQQLRCVAN